MIPDISFKLYELMNILTYPNIYFYNIIKNRAYILNIAVENKIKLLMHYMVTLE